VTNEEIDRLIAERVMGWFNGDDTPRGYNPSWSIEKPHLNDGPYYFDWLPSTDIACAWRVVQHIVTKPCGPARECPNFELLIEGHSTPLYVAAFAIRAYAPDGYLGNHEYHKGESTDLARAICFASLRLVGAIPERKEGGLD
jgi:hypothetical protein